MNRRNFIVALFSIPVTMVAKRLLPSFPTGGFIPGNQVASLQPCESAVPRSFLFSKQDNWPMKDTPCKIKVTQSYRGEPIPVVMGGAHHDYFVNHEMMMSHAWWIPEKKYRFKDGKFESS